MNGTRDSIRFHRIEVLSVGVMIFWSDIQCLLKGATIQTKSLSPFFASKKKIDISINKKLSILQKYNSYSYTRQS